MQQYPPGQSSERYFSSPNEKDKDKEQPHKPICQTLRNKTIEHDIETYILEQRELEKISKEFTNMEMQAVHDYRPRFFQRNQNTDTTVEQPSSNLRSNAQSSEKRVQFDLTATTIALISDSDTSESNEDAQDEESERQLEDVLVEEDTSFEGNPEVLNQKLPAPATAKNKTPLQNLYELFPAPKFNISWKDVSQHCFCHEGKFQVMINIGCLSGFGLGSSKKEAKHKAAQAVLDDWFSAPRLPERLPTCRETGEDGCRPRFKMMTIGEAESGRGGGADGGSGPASPELGKDFTTDRDRKSEVNKVGALQELCTKKNWDVPVYEFYSVTNVYHVATVTVNGRTGKGVGISKKAAKQEAAGKTLDLLYNEIGN